MTGLLLPKENGEFELPPSGSHLAICYRIVDLGTQQTTYKEQIKHQHKIMLSWELCEEKMRDGRPFSVHKRFTLSSHKKATMRQFLEAWRGVPFSDADFGTFDIGNLLAKPCMVGIVHENNNGNTYANISSIMRMPKGLPLPTLENEVVYFSLNNFDQNLFEKLSDGLKAVIQRSPEYQKLKGGHAVDQQVPDDRHQPNDLDDEIPF
jgi:hypothetical protein